MNAIAKKQNSPRPLLPRLRFAEFRGEWKQSKLGDCAVIVRGGSPRPIDDFLTTASDGLNWLKIGDVDKNAKYVTQTQEKIIPAALNKTREVNPGDLILSNSMSFGRPYIMKIKSCIHDGWIAVTNLSKRLQRDYLFYLMMTDGSQSFFSENAAGSGVQNLNADIIKLLPVLLPDDLEQQKIAACLSSLDTLITAEAQKLDTLKTHKKGLMQQLFPRAGETTPRLRFAEFRGEWGQEKLAELITTITPPAKLQTSDYLAQGSFPIIDQSQEAICGWTNDADAVVNESLPLIVFGDHTCAIKFVNEPFAQGADGIKIIKAKTTIAIEYLFQSINHNPLTMGDYKRHFSDLKERAVFFPDIKSGEQQKIAACLSSLDELITAQAQKVAALQTHKKGLMQQLFPAHDEASA